MCCMWSLLVVLMLTRKGGFEHGSRVTHGDVFVFVNPFKNLCLLETLPLWFANVVMALYIWDVSVLMQNNGIQISVNPPLQVFSSLSPQIWSPWSGDSFSALGGTQRRQGLRECVSVKWKYLGYEIVEQSFEKFLKSDHAMSHYKQSHWVLGWWWIKEMWHYSTRHVLLQEKGGVTMLKCSVIQEEDRQVLLIKFAPGESCKNNVSVTETKHTDSLSTTDGNSNDTNNRSIS